MTTQCSGRSGKGLSARVVSREILMKRIDFFGKELGNNRVWETIQWKASNMCDVRQSKELVEFFPRKLSGASCELYCILEFVVVLHTPYSD